MLLSVAIVRDTAGRPLHFTAQMVDISARKDIEQALAAAEQRWHYALEGSGLGVWDWNAETDRIFYSPRWKEMLATPMTRSATRSMNGNSACTPRTARPCTPR